MRKLTLPDVTLLAATSVNVEETLRALTVSSKGIEFGSIKLLATSTPQMLPPTVEFSAIPPMDFLGYSRFMIKDLHRYFDTPFCLVVQADGFVLNPDCWRKEFLQYDYIGAPWPKGVWVRPSNWLLKLERNRVGNGGFSLRSRKLVELTSDIDFDALDFPIKSEDILICHYLYDEMVKKGMRFAPPELAAIFSIESQERLYGQSLASVFGFHGKHWLKDVLDRKDRDLTSQAQIPPNPEIYKKIGRTDPCPCASGKRYKHCHGKLN
jgi:hypothetical protein